MTKSVVVTLALLFSIQAFANGGVIDCRKTGLPTDNSYLFALATTDEELDELAAELAANPEKAKYFIPVELQRHERDSLRVALNFRLDPLVKTSRACFEVGNRAQGVTTIYHYYSQDLNFSFTTEGKTFSCTRAMEHSEAFGKIEKNQDSGMVEKMLNDCRLAHGLVTKL